MIGEGVQRGGAVSTSAFRFDLSDQVFVVIGANIGTKTDGQTIIDRPMGRRRSHPGIRANEGWKDVFFSTVQCFFFIGMIP